MEVVSIIDFVAYYLCIGFVMSLVVSFIYIRDEKNGNFEENIRANTPEIILGVTFLWGVIFIFAPLWIIGKIFKTIVNIFVTICLGKEE
jgi:hypothetical protein